MKVNDFKKQIRSEQHKFQGDSVVITVAMNPMATDEKNLDERLISKVSIGSIFGQVADSSRKELLLIHNDKWQEFVDSSEAKKYMSLTNAGDIKLLPFVINWKHLLKWATRKENFDDYEMKYVDILKGKTKEFELSNNAFFLDYLGKQSKTSRLVLFKKH